MTVNITQGTGSASVAAELVGTLQYQRIEVMGQGGASVLAVNPDGSFNASIKGTPTVVIGGGSIATIASGNQSVSGTIGASVIGWVPIQAANTSVITVLQNSSIIAIVTGSVAALQSGNTVTSLVSTVPSSVLVGASIFGQLPAGTAMIGSITAYQGFVPWAIAGSVVGFQGGTWSTSVMTNVITSIATAGQVMGSVAALQATNPWNVAGSVAAFVVGNASIITVPQISSILAVPVGSVITVLQAASIVGTYAEDAPAASGDKGFLVMGARNDTLASVTSNDGDYSSHVVGPAGELISENAPLTKWVFGTADFRQGNAGASIIVIGTGGTSVFTYITGVQVANLGSASVLVTLASGGSVLGYTIAPAGGGSNIYYQNGLKTPGNFGFAASLNGIASVLVSAQGFISKS